MGSGRFATKENWGSGRQKHTDRRGGSGEKPQIFSRKKAITPRTSFLDDTPADVVHHEPPKYEMEAVGQGSLENQTTIPMNHGEHAAVHQIRYDLWGDRRDHDAYMAQATLMDDAEADILEKIQNSPELKKKLTEMIQTRHQRFGIR